ncbi:MAG: AraC family transcriptional regulator [Chloroflexota bacterium]|nr:MAG: AraC family transcriptional regulator [Chloroflexota bacterium]
MVCDRCIRVVRDELTALGLEIHSIELGKAIIDETVSRPDMNKVRKVLDQNGFELLEDQKAQLVDRIKTHVLDLIQHDKLEYLQEKISGSIAREVGRNYQYLSALFSETVGITIEKYIILQKIERIKELLAYNELTISEIAHRLGYSSVQHLSNQFKTITGLSPSHFKRLGNIRRNPLDQVS